MAILLRLADEVEEVLARVNLGGGGGVLSRCLCMF